MTQGTGLTVFKQALSPRGGALAKEFKRTRANESLHWNVEKDYALEMISGSTALQRCDPDSVARSLIDLSVMGLTLSPAQRLAYLIPYKRNCTASPSYMGLEQIAYRTGFVESIQTVLAHKNDPLFKVWTENGVRHVAHEEMTDGDRGPVTHVYTIAHLSSGKVLTEVMDRAAILACRDAAARKNDNKIPFTWTGSFRHEMYKKCCIRRAFKHWPRLDNPALRATMEALDRTDPMDFGDKGNVIDMKATLDQGQIDELIKIMETAGVPEASHDSWLHGLAKRFGYQRITLVKTERFDEVKAMMQSGVGKWVSNQASNSTQDASTQQSQAN